MKRMSWAGHVARVGAREIQTGFLCGGLKERVHFEDIGVDRRIILKCILKRWDVEPRVGLSWLMTGTDVGFFPTPY